MSNIFGKPGYVDLNAKPEPRAPMVKSGTVQKPPESRKPKTHKQRVKARDAARDLVGKVCMGEQWLVLGFRINDRGDVEMAHKAEDYPSEAMEDTAQLVAGLFARIAGLGAEATIETAHEPPKISESTPTDDSSEFSAGI